MAPNHGIGGRGADPVPPFVYPEAAAARPSGRNPGAGGSPALRRRSDATSGTPVAETVLENGIHVLTERIPSVRSAAMGVWIRQGSAHEDPERMGVSHLLEHMAFKGTRRRTPREIALALEGIGGALDAYTSREHTSFQARVLDEHLPRAMDVLSDLVLDPLLRPADLELEREVVLEEISTVEDTPDDLVFDIHGERLWKGHPYGHAILGTRETVRRLTAGDLRQVHRERYRGRNLVVAAAGNVDHQQVVEETMARFGHVDPGARTEAVVSPGEVTSGEERVVRDSAQTHVVFGTDLVPHADPRRYALVLLSAALGGGMSSRLFQRIREELALAYTVYTFQSFYLRGGVGGVYVGTRPGGELRAVEAVREEYARVAEEGLPEEELEQTREQVKGQIILSLESTASRLYRLAGFALYDEPYLGLDELLARIDAVTPAELRAVAGEFYHPDRPFVLRLGPASGPPAP